MNEFDSSPRATVILWVGLVSVLVLPIAADTGEGPAGQLGAVYNDLQALDRQIARILDDLVDPGSSSPPMNAVINKLEAAHHKMTVLERRMDEALDQTVDEHLAEPEVLMDETLEALADVRDGAAGIADQIGTFLELTPPDTIGPELREALDRIREAGRYFSQLADFPFYAIEYKRHIPVRFVQFFDGPEQILTDEQLENVIRTTNRVFQPARLKFHLWKNLAYYSPEFARVTDPDGNDYLYEWPADVSTSPLLKRLNYPEPADCPYEFMRPDFNIETRRQAQSRAGSYCASPYEILVYVNQSGSNGGEYPWYSRIIGMTRHHVLLYVFQHEVGHYLGLPHTFPGHLPYSTDYSFGRLIGAASEEDIPLLRRYYTPFEHLLNPETGGWAEYWDFWDLAFEPREDGQHRFFGSREQAMQSEFLQPIEQLASGVLCRPFDPDCAIVSPFTLLQMTVAAGCKGEPRDFSDCDYPPVNYYTGDPEVDGHSRWGSTPDTIQLNVMAYYYPWADGTHIGGSDYWVVEDVYLKKSQVEQVDRVLADDIFTRFSGVYGRRPELSLCRLCH